MSFLLQVWDQWYRRLSWEGGSAAWRRWPVGEPETQTHSWGVTVSTALYSSNIPSFLSLDTEFSNMRTFLSRVTVLLLSVFCHQGSDTPAEGVLFKQEDEHWWEGNEEAATGSADSLMCVIQKIDYYRVLEILVLLCYGTWWVTYKKKKIPGHICCIPGYAS